MPSSPAYDGTLLRARHLLPRHADCTRSAQAKYRVHRLNLDAGENQQLSYQSINPKGRVPALVTPRGVLTETPAILAFIAQSFSDAQLAPIHDAFSFAQLQSFNSFMASTLHVAHAHRMRGHRWVDDQKAIEAMQRKVPETVGASYRFIEDYAFIGPYVMGATYTVADPYLFTFARWMEQDGVDPSGYPKVAAHRDRMLKRPTVREALLVEGGSPTCDC